jgi:transposase
MSAIFYVLRTGCQWNALPRSLGASSTVHDMPPNIISCNYKDVLTGRVHVFDLTNLC